jgi:2-polyprenyl-3-methyl-5-hydroxy-6-metoxy-1,4-benzoquinol methylase
VKPINYNKVHKFWNTEIQTPTKLLRKILIKNIIPKAKGKKIALDLGCGSGQVTRFLIDKGYYVDSVDISNHAIKRLKKSLKQNQLLSARVSNIFSFKTKRKYDLITFTDVLEHIENDEKAIKLVSNLLKRNGILIFSVPACKLLFSEKERKIGHFRRYNKKEILNLLNEDFNINKIRFYGFPVLFLVWLIRKILNLDFYKKINQKKAGFLQEIIMIVSKIDRLFINPFIGVGVILIAKKQ